MTALLDGVRILDLTTVVVGPACSERLAEYGAEVIKLEPPGGDLMRVLGGPSPSGSAGGAYLHLNRGKRSICLDLKHPAAGPAVDALLGSCDVLLTNMRAPALQRLGLDAANSHARNQRLVHCTISGYGPDGPYRQRPAYDSVIQGVSGIAGAFWGRDNEPRYAPLLLADSIVGEIAAGAILAALVRRERNGDGAAIEVPMHETVAAFVLREHMSAATFEPPLGPPGDRRVLSPGNRPLETADGWISVTANSDQECVSLLRAIGRDELIGDVRFHTVSARRRNVDEWLAMRTEAFRERTTAAWLELFAVHDIAAMPCHSLESLLDDPHLVAVGLVSADSHAQEGTIRGIRPTLIVDGQTSVPLPVAEPLGHATRAVLREAGMTPEEVEDLFTAGVASDDSQRSWSAKD